MATYKKDGMVVSTHGFCGLESTSTRFAIIKPLNFVRYFLHSFVAQTLNNLVVAKEKNIPVSLISIHHFLNWKIGSLHTYYTEFCKND